MSATPEPDRLVVLVPTRNRAAMAHAAVRSVLDQDAGRVSVMVSDNSTDEAELNRLREFCAGFPNSGLSYVRPDQPLPMAEHWDWAIHQALDEYPDASHFTVLTDRMLYKRGRLADLLRLVELRPGRVLSYHQDMIDDVDQPVQALLLEATGKAFEVSSERILELTSKAHLHQATPRMLNSIVPRSVLEAVERRFGDVFGSISPDLQFGFRCLELVDSVIYYDEPPMVHYALSRSNGLSYARGVDSKESADFRRELGGVSMNHATPVPELITIRNACFHEYCVVRAQTGSAKFKAIDLDRYLYAISEEVPLVEDPAVRERMRELLSESGWRGLKRRFGDARRLAGLAAEALQPLRFGRRVLWRYRKHPFVLGLAGSLARLGSPALGWLRLESVDAAMHFVVEHPRGHESRLSHMRPLIDAPGAVRELTIDGQ